MRLLIHDYAGHAFPADLSRRLARRGHTVLHVSCASFPAPKGRLEHSPGDPEGLSFTALELPGRFSKYDFLRRWSLERGYGKRLRRLIQEWEPQAVLIGNTPLDPINAAFKECEAKGAAKLFWVQDLYSVAIERYLGERWGTAGRLIGRVYGRLEASITRRADALISITEGFVPDLEAWGAPAERITVQPNWAPLSDLPRLSRENRWAEEQGVTGRTVLLYAGTLGLKHDPTMLLELSDRLRGREEAVVVVVSEGDGARWLRGEGERRRLSNLRVLPFQPVERVAEMLATGDLLLSTLEPGAGRFCVPSKILAQLCAGRTLLAALPDDNDAARMIREADAGRVVPPGDREAWIDEAVRLIDDPALRRRLGDNGRRFAEARFDGDGIAERFEGILEACIQRRSGAPN